MLAVLSPAKSLDGTPPPESLPHSQPALLDQASKLAVTCRRQSRKKLSDLMGISPALAELNHGRFAAWTPEHTPLNSKQAALLFDGDTYRGLEASTLSPDDLEYAQDHLAILSGLYGVLRPLDLVQPYRLEMGTRLSTRRGSSLYDYWGERIGKELSERVAEHADRTLVNCASNEYFSAVRGKRLPPILHPEFRELRGDGRLTIISFFAKRARGAMARFLVQNRVDRAEGVKDFNLGGYAFQPDLSEGDRVVFVRPHPNEH